MPGFYSTDELTATVNSLREPTNFLLDTIFPGTITSTSEDIHFDVRPDYMGMAPFVSPTVEGAVMASQGYETDTFRPAYVKAKSPIEPHRAVKRLAGEPFTGTLSPQQRIERLVLEDLEMHRLYLSRRMEWMAAQVALTGSVLISGPGYQDKLVNYGRDAALTVVKGAGNKWSDAGIIALDDLQDWSMLVLEKSGAIARKAIMGTDVWKVFRRNNPELIKRMDTLRALGNNSLDMGAKFGEGGQYMGNIDGFELWVYAGFYKTNAGVYTPHLPLGTVLLLGDVDGSKVHGAIMDLDSLQAVPFFTKSWKEEDPSVRVLLTQSAPLVVPKRRNAMLAATVL